MSTISSSPASRHLKRSSRPLLVYTRKRNVNCRRLSESESPVVVPLPNEGLESVQEVTPKAFKRSRSAVLPHNDDSNQEMTVHCSPDGVISRPTKRAKFTAHTSRSGERSGEALGTLEHKSQFGSRPINARSVRLPGTRVDMNLPRPRRVDALDSLSPSHSSKLCSPIRPSTLLLKENETTNGLFSVLGSPFHSHEHSLTPSPAKRISNRKTTRNKQISGRTRSVAMNSKEKTTTAVHRYPSGPQTLSLRRQQSWLIPAHVSPKAAVISNTTESFSDADFRSLFSISPQASSTPAPSRSLILDVPPASHQQHEMRKGVSSRSAITVDFDDDMNDRTPSTETPMDPRGSPKQTISNPVQNKPPHDRLLTPKSSRKRAVIHISEDSIFLSPLDFSTSLAAKDSNTKSLAPQTSLSPITVPPTSSPPVVNITASSDDELGNMFSVLGIDEAEKVMHSALDRRLSSVSTGGRSTKKSTRLKKRKSSLKQSKVNIVGKQAQLSRKESQTVHQRSRSRRSTFFSSRARAIQAKSSPLPTIRMKTNAEALLPSSDEDDELLLTYRGWDWDPSSDI